MQTLWQDLRYGARMLFKNPGFTLIAVLTLGLGVGANTAIFSVVNGVLLRPLSYHEPEQIVTLLNNGQFPVSPANFLDFRDKSQSFAQMAAAEAWGGALTGADRPEAISGLRMGEGLFGLLGEQPLLGRTLQAEDYHPGKDHVLVLSHKLWQRAFGGDPNIIGRNITLSGESYAVVGVMPSQFQFPPFWSTRAEMWAPLDLRSRRRIAGGSSLRVFARLKPGVTLQQAQAEIDAMNKQLALAYPEANTGLNIRVEPLNEKVVGNIRRAAAGLVGRRRIRPADRVRECGLSAACSPGGAAKGGRRACGVGRQPTAHPQTAADREPVAFAMWGGRRNVCWPCGALIG